jgi:micrococcal nuclease
MGTHHWCYGRRLGDGGLEGRCQKMDKRRAWMLVAFVLVLAVPACVDLALPTETLRPPDIPTPAFERIEALVVRVIDGDTIKVRLEGQVYSVRYIGIDTPETVHPDRPIEWMGPEASAANKRLVEGQTVSLEKDVSEVDQYGRLLRYVYLADGTFVNAELVRLGYAQVSTFPPDVRYQDLFLEKQREAREAERGLWGPAPGS